jgi:hypothetical protein
MARGEFYTIYIERDPEVAYDDIKKVMDLGRDWYRLTSRYWIVYTTSDVNKWYSRLKKFVSRSGTLFICRLDVSERQGWMSGAFWEWLRGLEEKEDISKLAL